MFKKSSFSYKKKNLFFIIFWLLLIGLWLYSFPINKPFDIGDLIIEGAYLIAGFVGFFLIWKLPIISVGAGVFTTGLLIDFLDELTKEPDLLNTYIEGFLTVFGLLIMFFGFHQLVKAFRKSEKSLGIIMDFSPAMIWYKDTKNNFIRVNKKAAGFSGLKPKDFNGKSVDEVYPEEADKYYEDDREILRTKKPKLGIEEVLRDSSGEKIWVRTDKIPIFQNDEIRGILVFSIDITQEKKDREKLEKMNSYMVDREKRMMKLKEEIKKLRSK